MSASGGYTLLEMVVVMAVLALATALVGPSAYRMAQSWGEADGVAAVIRSVEALPFEAQKKGMEILLDGTTPPPPDLLDMPEDWQLQMDSPLVVRANGACSGASAHLVTLRQQVPLTIEAPFCRTYRSDDAAP